MKVLDTYVSSVTLNVKVYASFLIYSMWRKFQIVLIPLIALGFMRNKKLRSKKSITLTGWEATKKGWKTFYSFL